MTKTEAAQAIALLVCNFPNTKFSEENAKAYQAMILDLDASTTLAAVTALARTRIFLPVPAEIRAAVLDLVNGAARSPEDAWGDVVQAIRHHGSYRAGLPAFADPLVAHAVERMGWTNLCRTSNETADRARFCELYGHARDEGRKDRLAAPGLAEGVSRAALPAPIAGLLAGVGGRR